MIGSPGGWLFLAAPFFLGASLLWRYPQYRRFRWPSLVIYVVVMSLLIWGALAVVAHVATARIIYREIPIILWFTISWRLAWEIWSQIVNRIGASDRASSDCATGGLPASEDTGRQATSGTKNRRYWLKPVCRVGLTAVVFVPAFLSVVATHRCKLGDGTDPASTFNMAFEPVRIPTRDGLELDGWFIPETIGSDRTIIICHGAGANKGNFVWFLGPLAHRGYNVLFFDFRAHGASEGRTTTYGIRERQDVIAAVDWLQARRPQQSRTIVGLGSSQGAMALALAAADDPRIDAVILDSPFTSPRDLMRENAGIVPVLGPLLADLFLAEVSLQTWTDFFNASAEQAIRRMEPRPVMVIHGDGDFVMPRAHAQRLYDAAQGPRAIWFGPGPHSNIITEAPGEYAARLFEFLEANLGRPTGLR